MQMRAGDIVSSAIPFHVEPGAEPLLESGLGDLAPKILEIIAAEKEKGLPVKSVELTAFVDPEGEGPAELVFTVRTELPPAEALKAWDRLSDKVAKLREGLPLPDAELLDTRVAVSVEWD